MVLQSWKAFDDTSVGSLTAFPGTLPQTLSGSHDDKLSDNTNYNSQVRNLLIKVNKSWLFLTTQFLLLTVPSF